MLILTIVKPYSTTVSILAFTLGVFSYRFSNNLSLYLHNYYKPYTSATHLASIYCGYFVKLLVFALLTAVCMRTVGNYGFYYVLGTMLAIVAYWLEHMNLLWQAQHSPQQSTYNII